MMLYLYPEEWTGRRAREVHTLSTCIALAGAGRLVTLVTAGGEPELRRQLLDLAGADAVPGLEFAFLSRRLGPIRSAGLFELRLQKWLRTQLRLDSAFAIHLKAAEMLRRTALPYAFEAHEIFAESREAAGVMERDALAGAAVRIATSSALASALCQRYGRPDDFHIVPNAGLAPLPATVARADGPFVYCGSIADWKGLELVIAAAREARMPLSVVGGTEAEWDAVSARCDTSQVRWRPRVPVREIPQALTGSRAGLIPTLPEAGSGRYSCPMKLFDYARCGLPVISSDLPALRSLSVGSWCSLVTESSAATWTAALRDFQLNPDQADKALAWSAGHTWQARAKWLKLILPDPRPAGLIPQGRL